MKPLAHTYLPFAPCKRIDACAVAALTREQTTDHDHHDQAGRPKEKRITGQYTSVRFTETVALEGLTTSIGSVGDAYDDAAAETMMGLFKNEAIAKNSPFRTAPQNGLPDVEEVTFDWVNWYNNERPRGFLGNIPPEEYERNYYAQNIGAPTDDAANETAA